jgi:hypothetical protein
MRTTLALVALLLMALNGASHAQPAPGNEFEIRNPVRPLDSLDKTIPNRDSARIFDSIFAVRRAESKARLENQKFVRHQDFLSVKFGSTAFSRIRAGKLQRYFAERFERPNLDDEESNLTGLDRLLWFAFEAQFSTTWGIFAEYSYTGRWYGTDVQVRDSTDLTRLPLGHAKLEMNAHAFVVGPFVIPFETPFFRTKLSAGIGPSFTSIYEQDQTGAEREGTASGLALTFEAEFDVRIIQQLSFGLSLFTRQQSTGTITREGGGDLSDPFGSRTWKTATAPDASFINGGLGISLHYYF